MAQVAVAVSHRDAAAVVATGGVGLEAGELFAAGTHRALRCGLVVFDEHAGAFQEALAVAVGEVASTI